MHDTKANKRRKFRMYIRQPELHELKITKTLLDVLEVIEDYRVTTQDVIVKSVSASPSYINKVLTVCFHHGLVDRKRDEDEEEKWKKRIGSKKILYLRNNKGKKVLEETRGKALSRTNRGYKNKIAEPKNLRHRMMVDVFRSVVKQVYEQHDDFTEFKWKEKLGSGKNAQDTRIKVEVDYGNGDIRTRSNFPDGIFYLKDKREDYHCFYFEADRGTMRWKRFKQKIENYWLWRKQGLSEEEHGFTNFRVLTVTETAARRDSLIEKLNEYTQKKKLSVGRGMFWFASAEDYSITDPFLVLGPIWKTPLDDKFHLLIK